MIFIKWAVQPPTANDILLTIYNRKNSDKDDNRSEWHCAKSPRCLLHNHPLTGGTPNQLMDEMLSLSPRASQEPYNLLIILAPAINCNTTLLAGEIFKKLIDNQG